MEWIETTGKSIEEAKEAALDELGVDEQDAEFEVVAEPKTGLFGRMRVEARVRSRVRPTAPRPKDDRRGRRRSKPGSEVGAPATSTAEAAADAAPPVTASPDRSTAERISGRSARSAAGGSSERVASTDAGGSGGASLLTAAADPAFEAPEGGAEAGVPARTQGDKEDAPARNGGSPSGGRASRRSNGDRNGERDRMSNVDVPLEEQGEVAKSFLLGLVEEFGLTAEIAATVGEEDVVDVALSGADLGMLIGPKGTTLLALQDLTRSAVLQKTSAGNGRINVDVSGYRQKRSEALSRFALQVAETVKASGVRQALEPMSAVDRKVVHDTLTDVDGVATLSEGEDAQRRVVVIPSA